MSKRGVALRFAFGAGRVNRVVVAYRIFCGCREDMVMLTTGHTLANDWFLKRWLCVWGWEVGDMHTRTAEETELVREIDAMSKDACDKIMYSENNMPTMVNRNCGWIKRIGACARLISSNLRLSFSFVTRSSTQYKSRWKYP